MSKQKTVIAVALGQLLSLCITGTSSASSALWRHYAISIPFTQNLLNYLLLAIVYTLISYNRNQDLGPRNKISWQCTVISVFLFFLFLLINPFDCNSFWFFIC
jgi:solute carrier family 35 protein F1/2